MKRSEGIKKLAQIFARDESYASTIFDFLATPPAGGWDPEQDPLPEKLYFKDGMISCGGPGYYHVAESDRPFIAATNSSLSAEERNRIAGEAVRRFNAWKDLRAYAEKLSRWMEEATDWPETMIAELKAILDGTEP